MSTSRPRRRRGVASAEYPTSPPRRSREPGPYVPATLPPSRVRPPRTIRLGGTASPQLVSAEYPRRRRGVAATPPVGPRSPQHLAGLDLSRAGSQLDAASADSAPIRASAARSCGARGAVAPPSIKTVGMFRAGAGLVEDRDFRLELIHRALRALRGRFQRHRRGGVHDACGRGARHHGVPYVPRTH